jgi:hypothetical protein
MKTQGWREEKREKKDGEEDIDEKKRFISISVRGQKEKNRPPTIKIIYGFFDFPFPISKKVTWDQKVTWNLKEVRGRFHNTW